MSNDYLHLSPSQQYYYDGSEKEKKTSSNSNSSSNPPASNTSGLSGWTPLISKTYFNEQLLSFNSTPYKNGQGQELIDYSSGLNLTPFLTHNLNNNHANGWNGTGTAPPSAAFNSIQHQLSNITPFHDKTLQLTDFIMDSPIRNSPLREMETITPSKFRLGSEKKSKPLGIFSSATGQAVKRTISAVDTPPRQPHKLSISTRPDLHEEREANEETDPNDDKENIDRKKYYLQTPSKSALSDITNKQNFTPAPINYNSKKFQTPAKQIPDSSPSTVIMSSAVKSSPPRSANDTDEDEDQRENAADTEDESDSDSKHAPPGSPTPNKPVEKPIMGVFQEKKKVMLKKKKSSTFRNGVMGGGRNRMQAGMNKFQIVFTDVHALVNKTKKKPVPNEPNPGVSSNNTSTSHPNLQRIDLTRSKKAEPVSTYETSKELSMVSTSNHNNSMNSSLNTSTMNTSHNNLSTDQSSFELGGGGISSTPNSKYFLNSMTEKPSPQSQALMNSGYFLQQYVGPKPVVSLKPPMMSMVMSTPQHQSDVSYSQYETSPENHSGIISEHQLQQIHHQQEQIYVPGNYMVYNAMHGTAPGGMMPPQGSRKNGQ